jgi:hypothetical protein
MFDLYEAVADLQCGWQTLPDVDKGEKIAVILKHGTSGRTLASALKCDEKQVRNFAKIASTTDRDKAQAREGAISTRELVRRANMREQRHAVAAIKRAKANREKRALSACENVLSWFIVERLGPADAEQIVDRTREHLVACEMEGSLPKMVVPAGMSMEEIIKRLRPFQRPDLSLVEHYAVWLARWLYSRFPTPMFVTRLSTSHGHS